MKTAPTVLSAAHKPCWSPLGYLCSATIAATMCVLPSTHAATYDWTGTTSGNLSGTTTNWSTSIVPTGTDVARWNAATYTNAPTANASQTIGELLFDAGNTGGVTFGVGASTLTLNGISGTGIQVNSGSGAVSTGSAKFAIGAAQSWTNNSANTLTVGGTINLSTFLLTFDGSGTTTQSGIISGTGGVAVSAGTVNLNGANTFTTGGVALSGGTLVVGNTKSLGNAGAFTITGGTLDAISAGITLTTVGAEAWNGDFTFAGTGALNLSTAGVTLGGNRTVTVNASTLTVGGVINDGGNARSLTKAGNGALTLSGANTFTGGVTLSAGTLNINAAGVASTSGPLGNGGTFTINGGTIDNTSGTAKVLVNVNPITVGGNFAFSTSGGTALNNLTLPGAVTLTGNRTVTTNGAGVLSLTGAIGESGTSSLTKSGTGTLALTGANTFSGGLNVLNGIVTFGNTTTGTYTHLGAGTVTLGDSSGSNNATLYDNFAGVNTYANAITVAAGSSGNTLAIAGNNTSITFTNSVALNNNLTLANANSGKILTFSGLVTETSTGSPALTITNGATVSGTSATTALTGPAILSGGVVVGTGGLTLANNSGFLFTVGTGNITSTTTGNLTFNANSTGAFTVSAASINNAGTITNSGTGSGITTISGIIGTNVTGVTQNSSNSALTLSGANTYSTGTTVSSGTLRIGSSAVTTGTTITNGPTGTGNLTLNNGVTLATTGGTGFLIAAPTINLLGNITLNQTSGGTGRLQFAGSWDLGGGSRTIDIQKTSATIGSGNEGLGFTLPTGFTSPVVGNGSLSLISTAATPTTPAQVRFNTTTFTSNAALTVGDGVMLTSQNGSFFATGTGAPALTLNAAVSNGGGVLQLGDGINLGAAVTRSAEVYSLSGGGTVTSANTTGTVTTGTLTINNGNGATFSGIITETGGTGIIAVTKSGSGTQILSGTNTYTGATTISAGTLQLGNGGTTGSLSTSSAITNNGTFTINRSNAVAQGTDFSSAAITGTGGFVQAGSGQTTLNATNTYSGATTVSGGKLTIASGSINGTSGVSIGAGEFNYNSSTALTKTITFSGTGGTLSGSGTIGSAFTLTSGNTLSPGNSPGLLSTGAQTWNNGGNYNWQVVDATGTAGTGFDSVSITGGLNLSALTGATNFNINLWSLSGTGPDVNGNATNFDNTTNQSWTLVSTTTGVTGFVGSFFTINTGSINGTAGFTNPLGGGSFSLAVVGNNLNLIFTAAAIPEPATYGALFGAVALFGTAIYRRRRSN